MSLSDVSGTFPAIPRCVLIAVKERARSKTRLADASFARGASSNWCARCSPPCCQRPERPAP